MKESIERLRPSHERLALVLTIVLGVGCGGGRVESPGPAAPLETPSADSAFDEGGSEPPRAESETRSADPPPRRSTVPLADGSGDAIDALVHAGDEAYEAGDYDKALEAYGDAARRAPDRLGPQIGVSRTRLAKLDLPFSFGEAKGNPEARSAVRALENLARRPEAKGAVRLELGRGLLLLGEAKAALRALEQAIRELPDEAEAHSAKGIAHLALGDASEAAKEMEQAKSLDRGRASRHGNLGTVLLMLGRVDDAVRAYEEQKRLDPTSARTHADLGTAYLAQGRIPQAIQELREAIARDGSRAAFRSNLGYALSLKGDLAGAERELREAIRIDEGLASAWINLGTVLAKEPRHRKEARAAFKRAEKIDPQDPRVKANLAELDALEHAEDSKKTKP